MERQCQPSTWGIEEEDEPSCPPGLQVQERRSETRVIVRLCEAYLTITGGQKEWNQSLVVDAAATRPTSWFSLWVGSKATSSPEPLGPKDQFGPQWCQTPKQDEALRVRRPMLSVSWCVFAAPVVDERSDSDVTEVLFLTWCRVVVLCQFCNSL